jgi:hypothetical protein
MTKNHGDMIICECGHYYVDHFNAKGELHKCAFCSCTHFQAVGGKKNQDSEKQSKKLDYYRKALELMYREYNEKRTDVADNINSILENEGDLHEFMSDLYSEGRYVEFKVGNQTILYDSLTTLAEVSLDDGKTWTYVKEMRYMN